MNSKQKKQKTTIVAVCPELKSKILKEMLAPGSFIPDIAKSYNLSPKRLYNWRNNYRKEQSSEIAESPKTVAEGFVELKPFETTKLSEIKVASSNSSTPNLSQISLTIKDVSLSVDGNISSSSLIKILEALESC